MLAGTALQDKMYLGKDGTPVKVMGTKGEKVVLSNKATGHEVEVPKNYPLEEYDEKRVNSMSKSLLKKSASDKKAKDGQPKKESLASIIDPYLYAGANTVAEIVEILDKKHLSQAQGKNLNANVWARIVTFNRKGYKIERLEGKKIRVVKPKNQ
jgi:hypothetical protein